MTCEQRCATFTPKTQAVQICLSSTGSLINKNKQRYQQKANKDTTATSQSPYGPGCQGIGQWSATQYMS
jgi:hypothetical protein